MTRLWQAFVRWLSGCDHDWAELYDFHAECRLCRKIVRVWGSE